jgi:hypothetical protein
MADAAKRLVSRDTPEEAAELRWLVNAVADLNAFSTQDRAEVLETTLADPDVPRMLPDACREAQR